MKGNGFETKSFRALAESRLTKKEMAEIKRQAKIEIAALEALQNGVATAINAYVAEHDLGFNELVRRLESSPTHVARIKRGEANLTMASIARICGVLGKEPYEILRR